MAWRTSAIGMYPMGSAADWKALWFRPRSGGVQRWLSCRGARPRTLPARRQPWQRTATLVRRAAESGPNEAKLPRDGAKDPSYTGTVKTNAKSARQEKNQRSRRLGASSLPHPRPVAARSRARQAYAGRAGPPSPVGCRRRPSAFDESQAHTCAGAPIPDDGVPDEHRPRPRAKPGPDRTYPYEAVHLEPTRKKHKKKVTSLF